MWSRASSRAARVLATAALRVTASRSGVLAPRAAAPLAARRSLATAAPTAGSVQVSAPRGRGAARADAPGAAHPTGALAAAGRAALAHKLSSAHFRVHARGRRAFGPIRPGHAPGDDVGALGGHANRRRLRPARLQLRRGRGALRGAPLTLRAPRRPLRPPPPPFLPPAADLPGPQGGDGARAAGAQGLREGRPGQGDGVRALRQRPRPRLARRRGGLHGARGEARAPTARSGARARTRSAERGRCPISLDCACRAHALTEPHPPRALPPSPSLCDRVRAGGVRHHDPGRRGGEDPVGRGRHRVREHAPERQVGGVQRSCGRWCGCAVLPGGRQHGAAARQEVLAAGAEDSLACKLRTRATLVRARYRKARCCYH